MANEMTLLTLDAEGWGLIYNDNMTKINTWIDSILDSAKSANATGFTQVANIGDTISTPAAITASPPTITSVSGTGDDATINTNFTNIKTELDKAITDLGNLRNTIIANQTILTNLVAKQNELLAAIREGTGVAILKA